MKLTTKNSKRRSIIWFTILAIVSSSLTGYLIVLGMVEIESLTESAHLRILYFSLLVTLLGILHAELVLKHLLRIFFNINIVNKCFSKKE